MVGHDTMGAMSDDDRDPLIRTSFRRGARLASLPLGFAGRATVGLGKRIGGVSAEQVSSPPQSAAMPSMPAATAAFIRLLPGLPCTEVARPSAAMWPRWKC